MNSENSPLDKLPDLRQNYQKNELRADKLRPNPRTQFALWFEDARACKQIPEPNAMTLSTSDAAGRVTARVVLLKGEDERGFHFFTNYQSEKAQQIISSPQVALSFFWPALERQILIYGRAEKLPVAENKEYFASRPRGSQLGAWTSQQSHALENRNVLEEQLKAVTLRYENKNVPCPPHWGGFCVCPEQIEFWQGRSDRLHDRFRYTRQGANDRPAWKVKRLSP